MYQTKPLGIDIHFPVNVSFCGVKLAAGHVSEKALLDTLVR